MLFRSGLISLCLLVLWLLMSGVYQPLIIGFGVLSCILCVWIIDRLGLLQSTGMAQDVSIFRFVKYLAWLTVEIGKADWAVAKVILAPHTPDQQSLIEVPASQTSDFAKMVYANSITMTPGTVTVETEENYFVVHALTKEAADMDALSNMDKKVTALELTPTGRVA